MATDPVGELDLQSGTEENIGFQCWHCDRSFNTDAGRNIHSARVHRPNSVTDGAMPQDGIQNNENEQQPARADEQTPQSASSNLKWGIMVGEDCIKAALLEISIEVETWRKNTFSVPRGNCGADFIKELTRLINEHVHSTNWKSIGMLKILTFLPLMLQRPAPNSKTRVNSKYLSERLAKWSNGDLKSLLSEAKEIQKRLKVSAKKKQQDESAEESFCRLMYQGKIANAMRIIDTENGIKGVHPCSPDIIENLRKKHPEAKAAVPDILLLSRRQHLNLLFLNALLRNLSSACQRKSMVPVVRHIWMLRTGSMSQTLPVLSLMLKDFVKQLLIWQKNWQWIKSIK